MARLSARIDALLYLTLATLLGGQLHAQSSRSREVSEKSDLKAQLGQKTPQWLKQYDVPSVAIAYIENGKVAWTAVYGEQSPGVPATGKSLYNVASLTKPISAEVILRLASVRKLSLDEQISVSWIDPDVKDNPWNRLLTPRLCLSHQTGFPNWRYQTNGVLKFQWEPGTSTGYSGEGYDYVARFTEKKLGRSFEDLAKEYVFDPIGMKNTAYSPRDWYVGRVAVAQGPKGEAKPATQSTWNAADLLRTTIGDYANFVVSVIHKDGLTNKIATEQVTSTRNLASREKLEQLCTEAKVSSPSDCKGTAGMGLGWEVLALNGETIIDHSGSDWGVHTLTFFLPQRQFGMVVFTNGDNGEKVIKEIVSLAYHNPLFIATL
jgi:CubicO group peptidase (beta-lactamase class C family)